MSGKVSWVILVKAGRHCEPLWTGNIWTEADEGRGAVKQKAVEFLRKHFDEPARIVRIARGFIDIKFHGPVFDFDEF